MAIKLQTVIASWKKFDINGLQQDLDETASLVTGKQDESDKSRKKLVEQLKDFKKNAADDVCKSSASLIKCFQNEVDFLSKRSKFAEISFLKLYQKFLDVVDPTPSLEYCMVLENKLGTLDDIEIENRTIKETLKDYNEELREVRNQDVTIKNLKETLRKYESQLEIAVDSRIKSVEQNLISSYSDKEQLLHDSHEGAIKKLQESEERCQMLQKSLDQTQSELFDLKSKVDYGTEAKLGETEMLSNDLDRVTLQAASAQKELANVKEQYAMMVSETNESNKDSHMEEFSRKFSTIEYSSLEAEISGKDKEISQLIQEVNNLQKIINNLKHSSLREKSSFENEIREKNVFIVNYEEKLVRQKDYDEIKRELAIIKSIEFDSMDDLNLKNPTDAIISKPLELLLLEKNKTLQKDNTSIKLINKELSQRIDDLEKCDVENTSLVNEQRNLICQLETDLLSIQKFSNDIPSTENLQLQVISEALKDVSTEGINESRVKPNLYPEISSASNSQSATESLLSIVSAQRERFKTQNDELEAQITVQGSQLLLLQNELDTLRGDNIKLYEKIRFLQSYQGSTHSTGSSFPESRYSDQYESSLDPFGSFSQREKQNRYTSLSPFEKVTLSLGQFVLKNKRARTATFLYLSFLHILIFLVLYKFALTESFKRDFSSDCAKKFAEHMHDVHGQS